MTKFTHAFSCLLKLIKNMINISRSAREDRNQFLVILDVVNKQDITKLLKVLELILRIIIHNQQDPLKRLSKLKDIK